MQQTTRTQRDILLKGSDCELGKNEATQLALALRQANVQIIVINSSPGLDKIIPDDYKQALHSALRSKLPHVAIHFADVSGGGHMLQVEQLQPVLDKITHQP